MLPLEFDSQIKRLKETYKDHAYPPERVRLLWNSFKKLPEGMFERIVDRLIAYNRQVPMQDDFAAAATLIANERRPMDAVIKRIFCKDCDGYGYYLCHNPNGGAMVGSCPRCSAGADLRARDTHPIPDVRDVKRLGYSTIKKAVVDDRSAAWWESTQAPGTPPSIECLCLHIKAGTTSSAAFNRGLMHTNLTEKEMWEVYQAWSSGKVHPLSRRHFSLASGLLRDMPMNNLDWRIPE